MSHHTIAGSLMDSALFRLVDIEHLQKTISNTPNI